jgi:hypothetical protein
VRLLPTHVDRRRTPAGAAARATAAARRPTVRDFPRTNLLTVSATFVKDGEDMDIMRDFPLVEEWVQDKCIAGVVSVEKGGTAGHLHIQVRAWVRAWAAQRGWGTGFASDARGMCRTHCADAPLARLTPAAPSPAGWLQGVLKVCAQSFEMLRIELGELLGWKKGTKNLPGAGEPRERQSRAAGARQRLQHQPALPAHLPCCLPRLPSAASSLPSEGWGGCAGHAGVALLFLCPLLTSLLPPPTPRARLQATSP